MPQEPETGQPEPFYPPLESTPTPLRTIQSVAGLNSGPDPAAVSSADQEDSHEFPAPAPSDPPEMEPVLGVEDAESLDAEPLDGGELADWKEEIRADFEAWLDGLEEIPELESEEPPPETPDLYSFYAQWSAANAEARKGNRRTAEAFSQWGDTLQRFEGDLRLLRDQWQRLASALPAPGLSREHCLVLVDLLDRFRRVGDAFGAAPRVRWWVGGQAKWRKAWETQRQAFEILLAHLESFLRKEGVERIDTVGQMFDPVAMVALAVESDPSRPDQTVLEELAPGYRLRGELLRPAQVKVSRLKTVNQDI